MKVVTFQLDAEDDPVILNNDDPFLASQYIQDEVAKADNKSDVIVIQLPGFIHRNELVSFLDHQADNRLGIGRKHRDETFKEVYEHDPGYYNWAMKLRHRCPELQRFVEWAEFYRHGCPDEIRAIAKYFHHDLVRSGAQKSTPDASLKKCLKRKRATKMITEFPRARYDVSRNDFASRAFEERFERYGDRCHQCKRHGHWKSECPYSSFLSGHFYL